MYIEDTPFLYVRRVGFQEPIFYCLKTDAWPFHVVGSLKSYFTRDTLGRTPPGDASWFSLRVNRLGLVLDALRETILDLLVPRGKARVSCDAWSGNRTLASSLE